MRTRRPARADAREIMRTGQPIVGPVRARGVARRPRELGLHDQGPLRDRDRRRRSGSFGISRDITERQLAEEHAEVQASSSRPQTGSSSSSSRSRTP